MSQGRDMATSHPVPLWSFSTICGGLGFEFLPLGKHRGIGGWANQDSIDLSTTDERVRRWHLQEKGPQPHRVSKQRTSRWPMSVRVLGWEL